MRIIIIIIIISGGYDNSDVYEKMMMVVVEVVMMIYMMVMMMMVKERKPNVRISPIVIRCKNTFLVQNKSLDNIMTVSLGKKAIIFAAHHLSRIFISFNIIIMK